MKGGKFPIPPCGIPSRRATMSDERMPGVSRTIGRLRANLPGEIDGAALYVAITTHERDAWLAEVHRQLAAVEERDADLWREELGSIDPDDLGGSPWVAAPGLRARRRWG